MCGEKNIQSRPERPNPGSPPHVRGKATERTKMYQTIRITPACAGKRSSMTTTAAPAADHPRMCGEKTKKIP